MIQKEPSPVFAWLSSFADKAGWGLGLDLWLLRAWVLKGLDHPQALKGFFGLNW